MTSTQSQYIQTSDMWQSGVSEKRHSTADHTHPRTFRVRTFLSEFYTISLFSSANICLSNCQRIQNHKHIQLEWLISVSRPLPTKYTQMWVRKYSANSVESRWKCSTVQKGKYGPQSINEKKELSTEERGKKLYKMITFESESVYASNSHERHQEQQQQQTITVYIIV